MRHHAASYLTKDTQFHAGTVGDLAGRATVARVLASQELAYEDLTAILNDTGTYKRLT